MSSKATIDDVLAELRELRDQRSLDHGRMWNAADVGRYIGGKSADAARRLLAKPGAPRPRQATDADGRRTRPVYAPAEIVAWWDSISRAA